MAYKLIHNDEPLPEKNLVTVLFGEPGTGKTSIANTAESPLLMDFDEGLERSVGRKLAVKFDKWEDVTEFIDSNTIEKENIKTLITDTGGTMLDDYVAHYVIKQDSKNSRGGGDLSLQGYGAQKKVFEAFLSKLRTMGVDLIIVCHSRIFEDDGQARHRPKMTGGSYDNLISKADLVGYMEMKNNKISLNFNPTDRHIGKNCAQFPNLEVPNHTTPEYQNYMANIIQKTKEFMWRRNEAQVKAVKDVEEFREKIQDTETLVDLGIIKKEIYELSPMYRAQVEQAWNDKYVELWPKELLTKECKDPEDFQLLSDELGNMAKYLSEKLREPFKAHMEKQGVEYDPKAKQFVAKPKKSKEDKTVDDTKAENGKPKEEAVDSDEKPKGDKDTVTSKPGEKVKGQSELSL